jgi:hypothetical protein
VKVMAHLMFGVLVLTVDQLIRLNETWEPLAKGYKTFQLIHVVFILMLL